MNATAKNPVTDGKQLHTLNNAQNRCVLFLNRRLLLPVVTTFPVLCQRRASSIKLLGLTFNT